MECLATQEHQGEKTQLQKNKREVHEKERKTLFYSHLKCPLSPCLKVNSYLPPTFTSNPFSISRLTLCFTTFSKVSLLIFQQIFYLLNSLRSQESCTFKYALYFSTQKIAKFIIAVVFWVNMLSIYQKYQFLRNLLFITIFNCN